MAKSGAGTVLWWEYILLFAVVVAVMLLTSILPQRRREREMQKVLDSVRRGVRVVTRGGIHGMVTDVQGDVVLLRVAEKVEIKVAKDAIAQVLRSADAPEEGSGAGGGRKGRRQG